MKFLRENRVGLVLRAYARTKDHVDITVDQLIETFNMVRTLRVDGMHVFSQTDVMIAADDRYVDYDCGLTAQRLNQLAEGSIFPFSVTEVKEGDLFCSLLNAGFFNQIRGGMDYTMILSHGVLSYVTPENMRAMLEALEKGARVTGLAINEFEDSVLEGRILNTCSIWHNESWMRVGGYDLRSGQPRENDRSLGWIRDAPDGGDDKWSFSTGVEEMIPLINLIRLFGPCLAPILPQATGTWKRPSDTVSSARERRKISTKRDRQLRAAYGEGVSFSFIKNGIMPEYRDQ